MERRAPERAGAGLASSRAIHAGYIEDRSARGARTPKTRRMTMTPPSILCIAAALTALAVGVAHAGGTVGTTLPAGFPTIEDTSLHQPLIGFGAAGAVTRTPVIFIHGNNDTPFPTPPCNPFGAMQAFAQFFADNGYST